MCGTNCCYNTPTSEMENQKRDSCALPVTEEAQWNQLSLFPEWESGCCGNATGPAAAGPVAVDQSNLPTEDELGRQYLGEWWDAHILDKRQSYLATLWKRFVASIT